MGRDRRILVLTHNYPRWPGDFAGVFLEELVRKFCEDGVQVHVLAPHFAKSLTRETSGLLRIQRFRYGPEAFETLAYAGNMHKQVATLSGMVKFILYMICNTLAAIRVTLKIKPDLIFAQWLAPSGIVGWKVSLVTRRKLYVASHGTDIALLKRSSLLRMVARVVFKRTRKAFMVSNYLRETALDLDLALPEKLEVCPMPARTAVFGKAKVVTRTPPLVLCVARFTRQKQLDVLLKALRKVADQDIDFTCEIYGQGELESAIKRLVDDLKLTDRVSLHEPVDQSELAQIYPAARVTVLPSIEEGFGMTLVEAQLSGSAVIGARSGGIIDIIRHDETGLLFKPGSVVQLATQIAAVLTDDSLYRQLITNARRSAEENFSPQAIARKYEQALGLSLQS
jgi:glycosyltransferase involved in cell wall biosynthesis